MKARRLKPYTFSVIGNSKKRNTDAPGSCFCKRKTESMIKKMLAAPFRQQAFNEFGKYSG
jgi:hypothetical protein